MGRRPKWSWLLVLVSVVAAGALAEELPLFPTTPMPGGPWRLKARRVEYDAAARTFTAEGEVELVQGERRLRAQWAQVSETTRIARLKGNVVFMVEEDILTGQEGTFNLVTQAGEMKGARLFLRRNHFRLDSARLRKTGEQTYEAEEAVITTCDADRPAWSFKAKKIQVMVEGMARSRGITLHLAGKPVLFLPFLTLPVLTQRQSGFLTPNLEVTKASGTVLEFPFYWAISHHADATFYQNFLSRRGYMQGVELRYRGRGGAAGELRFVYLKDGRGDTDYTNRFWLAGMVDQPLGSRFQLRLTADHVSDANYLERFNFGYLGLNRYSRELLAQFGRQLEQEEVKTRVSTLVLAGNLPWAHLTAYGRNYQRLLPTQAYPFHKIPGISFATRTLPVGRLPLLVGLGSSYGYYLQERGGSGHRLEFHPQVWFQTQPFSLFSFETRAGFRETLFMVDDLDPAHPKARSRSRELFDLKATLSSTWYRDYGKGSGNGFFRHYLRPEVTYWNLPPYDIRRLPYFYPFDWGWREPTSRNLPVREGEEPLGGVNALTYGFSSSLLKRRQNSQGQALVREVFWFRLLHGAFFNHHHMGLDGSPQPHYRFADFLGELELYPFKGLILGGEGALSPYHEGLTRAKAKLIFFDQHHQRYVDLSYVYLKDFANQINLTASLKLLPSVRTWLSLHHTFLGHKKLERRFGLILLRQCWGVAFSYTDRPDDQRVSFTVIIPSLLGRLHRLPVVMPPAGEETHIW